MSESLPEMASILAAGIRRLHAHSALCITTAEDAAEDEPVDRPDEDESEDEDEAEGEADFLFDSLVDCSPDRLEVPGPLPLHGPTGLTAGDVSAAPAEPVETTHEA